MALFAKLQQRLLRKSMAREDMPEEIDTIMRLSSVRDLLEFEATRFVRVNAAIERVVEISYSMNFIPMPTQGFYEPLQEVQVLDSIIDMSNARALAHANLMSGTSVRETRGSSNGILGGFHVDALEYRLNINGVPARPNEIASSSSSQSRASINSISVEEIQEVMNMFSSASIGYRSEISAFLEVSVIRTEAYVPVVHYNTTEVQYSAPEQGYQGYIGNTYYHGDGASY